MSTTSPAWLTARARRSERRATDPQVQARAEAHRRREAVDRQKALRTAQTTAALASHLEAAS